MRDDAREGMTKGHDAELIESVIARPLGVCASSTALFPWNTLLSVAQFGLDRIFRSKSVPRANKKPIRTPIRIPAAVNANTLFIASLTLTQRSSRELPAANPHAEHGQNIHNTWGQEISGKNSCHAATG